VKRVALCSYMRMPKV